MGDRNFALDMVVTIGMMALAGYIVWVAIANALAWGFLGWLLVPFALIFSFFLGGIGFLLFTAALGFRAFQTRVETIRRSVRRPTTEAPRPDVVGDVPMREATGPPDSDEP